MDQLYGTHDFKTYDDMPDFTPAPKPVKRKRNHNRRNRTPTSTAHCDVV
jgi:hypothetical protein